MLIGKRRAVCRVVYAFRQAKPLRFHQWSPDMRVKTLIYSGLGQQSCSVGSAVLYGAACPGVEPPQNTQRDAASIESCDQPVSERQTKHANFFIASRAYDEPFAGVRNSTASVQHTKKFHILQDGRLRKPSELFEELPPAKNAMITASHPQQDSSVVSKVICEPVNERRLGQSNAEVTACNVGIV